MALIDIRSPIQMSSVSKILLQVAENPLRYVEHAQHKPAVIPGHETIVAAELARQASASVVSNCVIELWSATVCNLHALEPDFPLYPSSVVKFIKDTRLPFLSYISLYYSICKEPFEGTSTFAITGSEAETETDDGKTKDKKKPAQVPWIWVILAIIAIVWIVIILLFKSGFLYWERRKPPKPPIK